MHLLVCFENLYQTVLMRYMRVMGVLAKPNSRGLLIGNLFSELRDGTSNHFSHMGLHKKVSVIQDVDNELL